LIRIHGGGGGELVQHARGRNGDIANEEGRREVDCKKQDTANNVKTWMDGDIIYMILFHFFCSFGRCVLGLTNLSGN
jgi:hypothetical protein